MSIKAAAINRYLFPRMKNNNPENDYQVYPNDVRDDYCV